MDIKKDTIFITIDRGLVARNFLLNSFFEKLKEKYEVVIFTPLYEDLDFINEFGGSGVYFEKLKTPRATNVEKVVQFLLQSLIYNPSLELRAKYGYSEKTAPRNNLFLYWFRKIIFGYGLSHIPILRDGVRFIDAKIIGVPVDYSEAFNKYKPKAIFITNIAAHYEAYIIREAKRRNILALGMTKSWDNFTKNPYREKVDKLCVWGDFMKDEAIKYQNYKPENVEVVGIPQFDIYAELELYRGSYNREYLIKKYKLDPTKKLIVFGSGGEFCTPNPFIASVIKKNITEGKLSDFQLLIRPHFGGKDKERFEGLVDNENVFIDVAQRHSHFKDQWDFRKEYQLHSAAIFKYSDIVVSSVSTLVLDVLALENNFISYGFDENPNTPMKKSIKRFYMASWVADFKRTGLDDYIVHDEKELIDAIISCAKDGAGNNEARERILSRFCYKIDGESGPRIFNEIDDMMTNSVK